MLVTSETAKLYYLIHVNCSFQNDCTLCCIILVLDYSYFVF